MQAQSFQLVQQGLGAIPILDQVIQRLGLSEQLTAAMGPARYAEAILLLLKNVVIERNALYAIREWAAQLLRGDLIHGHDSKLLRGIC